MALDFIFPVIITFFMSNQNSKRFSQTSLQGSIYVKNANVKM